MPPAAVPAPKPAAKPARGGWFNPFRPPQPVATAPVVKAVQPELSLDAVKVLHNDLTDADVEVVPLQSRTAKQPTAVAVNFTGEPALPAI